jgi:hypothetical protein
MFLVLMSACSSSGASQRLQVGERTQFSEELWELQGSQLLTAVRALNALQAAHPEIRLEEFLVSYTANSDSSVYISFYKPSVSTENKQTGEIVVQKNSTEYGVVVAGEAVRVVR